MTDTKEKTEISAADFQKRVEIEIASLMYLEYMRKSEAVEKAKEYVSSKFKVAEKA